MECSKIKVLQRLQHTLGERLGAIALDSRSRPCKQNDNSTRLFYEVKV
jgi:hypothetical protein